MSTKVTIDEKTRTITVYPNYKGRQNDSSKGKQESLLNQAYMDTKTSKPVTTERITDVNTFMNGMKRVSSHDDIVSDNTSEKTKKVTFGVNKNIDEEYEKMLEETNGLGAAMYPVSKTVSSSDVDGWLLV